jgi:hypothetical protein
LSLLGKKVVLRTLFSNSLSLFCSSVWVVKLHTHTKQQAKL